MLGRIQNDLFDLGADLCTPEGESGGRAGAAHRGLAGRAPGARDRRHERRAAPLNSFILPGGSPAAAWLHLARTVARRAERGMTALAADQPVNPEAIKYINRLSDHLFVLAAQAQRQRRRPMCCGFPAERA